MFDTLENENRYFKYSDFFDFSDKDIKIRWELVKQYNKMFDNPFFLNEFNLEQVVNYWKYLTIIKIGNQLYHIDDLSANMFDDNFKHHLERVEQYKEYLDRPIDKELLKKNQERVKMYQDMYEEGIKKYGNIDNYLSVMKKELKEEKRKERNKTKEKKRQKRRKRQRNRW